MKTLEHTHSSTQYYIYPGINTTTTMSNHCPLNMSVGLNDSTDRFYVNIFKSFTRSVFNQKRIEVILCALATALNMTHRKGKYR